MRLPRLNRKIVFTILTICMALFSLSAQETLQPNYRNAAYGSQHVTLENELIQLIMF